MIYSALIPVSALLATVFILAYVAGQRQHNKVNRAYLFFGIVSFLWIVDDLLLVLLQAPQWYIPLLKIRGFWGISICFVYINFIYAFLNRRADLWYWFLAIITLFAVIVEISTNLIFAGFKQYPWGIGYQEGPWFGPTLIPLFGITFISGIILVWRKLQKTSSLPERRPLLAICLGSLGAITYIGLAFSILPGVFHFDGLLQAASSGTLILSFSIFWAVLRYNFLSRGLSDIAHELFVHVQDGIVVIDRFGHVVQINNAAGSILGISTSVLSDTALEQQIPGYNKAGVDRSFEVELPATNGLTRRVLITQSNISAASTDVARILIIKDITELTRAQKRLQEAHDTLECKVQERTIQLEHDIADRVVVEQELRRRIAYEELIDTIITPMVKCRSSTVESTINQALSDIGRFCAVDRCDVFLLSPDREAVHFAFEWCASGISAQRNNLQNLPVTMFPWWFEQFGQFKSIVIKRVSDLPEAALAERQILAAQGIQSFLAVPLIAGGELAGFLAIETMGGCKNWNEETAKQLSFCAEIVINALQRTQVEAVLAAEKEQLAVTLSSIGEAVITTNTTGQVVMLNCAAEKLLETVQEQAKGRLLATLMNLVLTEGRTIGDCLDKVVSTGSIIYDNCSGTLTCSTGAVRQVVLRVAPLFKSDRHIFGAVVVITDVTEKQTLENELFKSRKLESIGTLAGGIAHNFNNILTGIITNLFMVKMLVNNDEARTLINEAELSAFKAGKLVKQLSLFSHGSLPVKERINLLELVKDTVGFCLSGSECAYDLQVGEDLWDIEADRGQIDQVISNLIINALQAMAGQGIITIKLDNVSDGSAMADGRGNVSPLKKIAYVRLTVCDQGPGIPPDHLEKIFDPYFTTKESGTGLGLMTVYAIVHKHGGHIIVDSVEGSGSAFAVYLPAVELKPVVSPLNVEELVIPLRGRILVMDDDAVVRVVVVKMLRKAGYEVECAAEGKEAVALYLTACEQEKSFDVVILDLTIPGGMGGKETAERILAINRAARIIVFSGYTNDPMLVNYRQYGFCGVIPKPFSIGEFNRVLQEVMRGL